MEQSRFVLDTTGHNRQRRSYETYDTVLQLYQEREIWRQPNVVTLLGSAAFDREYRFFSELFTLAGCLVYSSGAQQNDISEVMQMRLTLLSFSRIAHSDIILVINGVRHHMYDYLGPSTRNGIAFARSLGKSITFAYPHACRKLCQCNGYFDVFDPLLYADEIAYIHDSIYAETEHE